MPWLQSGKPSRVRTKLIRAVDWCADMGRIAVLDLRLEVVRWTGPEWSVTYIGEGESIEAIGSILYPQTPQSTEGSRTSLWKASGLIKQYTGEGDLVICELNKSLLWSFHDTNPPFIMPRFVKQTLYDIDRPIEDVLAVMNQSMRRKIRKLADEGFTFTYTQEKDDFDHFYYRMYLPYITSRHEGRGMVLDDYESTYNEFLNGGMILIMDGENPVCGMLCQMENGNCRALQMGVLDADFEMVKRGINVALWWYMLLWGREQGATQFDFGSSRAYTKDGVFNFKRQWGTQAKIHPGIHTQWTFYTKDIPAKLRDHLNSLGIITSVDGKCYELMLLDPQEPSDPKDFTREISRAADYGLEGLAVISDSGDIQVVTHPDDQSGH